MHRTAKLELLDSLRRECPAVAFEEKEYRSLDIVCQILAYGVDIGAFAALWKVVQLWVDRHANVTVQITYTTEDAAEVSVEYSHLTRGEVDRILKSKLAVPDQPVKIVATKNDVD